MAILVDDRILLRYGYQPGEQYLYHQTVTSLLEEPGAEPTAARVDIESATRVLEADEESVSLEIGSRVVATQGQLDPCLPPFLSASAVRVRLDRQGRFLEVEGGALPSGLGYFPADRMAPGESWQMEHQGIVTRYELISVEPGEAGGHVARLRSRCASETVVEDERVAMLTESESIFAVEAGATTSSISVVELTWPGGRKVSTVVQNSLVHWEPASA